MTQWKILTQRRFLLLTKFIFRNSSTNYAYYKKRCENTEDRIDLGTIEVRIDQGSN